MIRGLLVLACVGLSLAAICPMEKHQVCNADSEDYKCVCAMTLEESPAPQQSCSNLIKLDKHGNFPVVQVSFGLDESDEGLDKFPEEQFRTTLASSLRVEEEDIIILRAGCQGTDDTLTVQFAVLKKEGGAVAAPARIAKISAPVAHHNATASDEEEDEDEDDDDKEEADDTKENEDEDEDDEDDDDEDDEEEEEDMRMEEDEFVDAESIATRMKAMGHLARIGDLEVDSIEFTDELIDIEFAPDNSLLIIQGIACAIFIGLCILLAVYSFCRNREYSDDLQKV